MVNLSVGRALRRARRSSAAKQRDAPVEMISSEAAWNSPRRPARAYSTTSSWWKDGPPIVQKLKRRALGRLAIVAVFFFVIDGLSWRFDRHSSRAATVPSPRHPAQSGTGHEVQALMVVGDFKSGATFVRQLLLDNILLAPLDIHEHDHHNEPAMALARERLGIDGSESLPRQDATTVARTLKARPLAASKTLLVLVVKHPLAWLASIKLRPHPAEARTKPQNYASLLKRRSQNTRDALSLGSFVLQQGGAFEIITYEDALGQPHDLVLSLAFKYSLSRRRAGMVDLPRHHTGDISSTASVAPFHGAARRARYQQNGPFLLRDYYLEKDYFSEFNSGQLSAIARQCDHDLERDLGFTIPASLLQTRSFSSRRLIPLLRQLALRSTVSVLGLLECLVVAVFVIVVLTLLSLAPVVTWRIQRHSRAESEDLDAKRQPLREVVHDLVAPKSNHVETHGLLPGDMPGTRNSSLAGQLASPAFFAMWGELRADADDTSSSTDSDESDRPSLLRNSYAPYAPSVDVQPFITPVI